MPTLIESLGAPAEHFEAIGKVASGWSLFETVIDLTIWQLAGAHHLNCACMTAQIMGASRKLSLVKLRENEAVRIKELNAIAKDTQNLSERRNRIVHDPWMEDQGKIHRLQTTARKILKLERVHTPIEHVNQLIQEIDAHTRRYIDAMRPFFPDETPLPERPS